MMVLCCCPLLLPASLIWAQPSPAERAVTYSGFLLRKFREQPCPWHAPG